MTSAYVIQAYIGGSILLGLITLGGVSLYWARTLTQDFLKYFSNSPWILMKATSTSDSLILKLMFIGAIASSVTFPKGHIKRGELSSEDLRKLPAPIKRKLVIMHWTLIWLTMALMINYGIAESGWIEAP